MKNYLFILLSLLFFQSSAQSYLGIWEHTDVGGNAEYIEFDSDTFRIYTYSAPIACYNVTSIYYTESAGQFYATVFGIPVTMPFSGSLTIDNFMGSGQQLSLTSSSTNISSLVLCSSPPPPPTTDYIGQWTNNDTVFLEITNDSILSYEFDMGCYDAEALAYTDNGNGSLTISLSGQPLPIFYTLSNNNTQLEMVLDTDTIVFSANTFDISNYTECTTLWECDVLLGGCFESSLGQFQTEAECLNSCNSGGIPSYAGQWVDLNDSVQRYVIISNDTILVFQQEPSGCFNLVSLSFTDNGNSQLIINGLLTATYGFSGDTLSLNIPAVGDFQLLPDFSFDTDSAVVCTYHWACNPSGCEDVGVNNGTYNSEIDCQTNCNSSNPNDTTTYLDMWRTFNDSIRYMHFTDDSLRIYQFDSTNCFIYNSLVYNDIGSSQLQISGIITANYSFSSEGDTMSIAIASLGSFDMVRDSFNVSAWTACSYNWKCNPSGCEEVGNDNGSFHSEADCIASCDSTITITEYSLDVNIYPNPFEEYAVLTFSSAVSKYQLYDVMGRFVHEKIINTQVDYLHKGELPSGFYILRLVGEKEIKDKKLIIK